MTIKRGQHTVIYADLATQLGKKLLCIEAGKVLTKTL